MPIYEYQCQQCGHRSEEMQRLADALLTVCPVCGGEYKKLVSAPAFQFKGTGWYVTDYARKSGEGKEGGGKSNAGKEGGGKDSASGSSDGDGGEKKSADSGDKKAEAPAAAKPES